jgi:hypothetical protein
MFEPNFFYVLIRFAPVSIVLGIPKKGATMTRSGRAMQVSQILVGAAHNRKTFTYRQVADRLKFEGARVLAQILGCIMNTCYDSKSLPPLTCLMVKRTTGLPGTGLTTVENLPRDREAVYNHNWSAMYPVQIGDFGPFAEH